VDDVVPRGPSSPSVQATDVYWPGQFGNEAAQTHPAGETKKYRDILSIGVVDRRPLIVLYSYIYHFVLLLSTGEINCCILNTVKCYMHARN